MPVVIGYTAHSQEARRDCGYHRPSTLNRPEWRRKFDADDVSLHRRMIRPCMAYITHIPYTVLFELRLRFMCIDRYIDDLGATENLTADGERRHGL